MSYSNYYATSGLFHGSLPKIMGTQLDLLMLGGDSIFLEDLWAQIEIKISVLDKMLNHFDPNSEVSFINRTAVSRPVYVSETLWEILTECKEYYERTEGLFDISLRDFKLVELDTNHNISFAGDGIRLDLGGFGKGYALLEIQQLLKNKGIEKALVNFGNSSVLAVGTHPYGDYWPIGLDNPYNHKRIVDLHLKDEALSTSGNMPSHPRHIIDPRSGLYMSEKKMVSVVAEDPLVAEVLTTAFMIADDERMMRIANRFKIKRENIYKYQL